jgi:hypothetical protein
MDVLARPQVVVAQGGMAVETVDLLVGRTGDKSYLDAVCRTCLCGIGMGAKGQEKKREDYTKCPKNVFYLFHDAKLSYIFEFPCF